MIPELLVAILAAAGILALLVAVLAATEPEPARIRPAAPALPAGVGDRRSAAHDSAG